MKRLIILIMLAVGLTSGAQNTLSLSGDSGHPGDTVTVTLSLANSEAVTAMQTFIPLGDNLTYVPGSATLTSRSNGHQLTASVLEGSLRLYSYSLSLNSYEGTSGALLTFRLVLGEEPGNNTLTPTSTVLSSATGSALGAQTSSSAITILAPKVQVTPASLDYGHVPIRSSYTRSVTVKNIGTESLTLTGVTFSDNTLSANTTTATLAAGAQCNITLTYSPVQAGATTMTAAFLTNATVGNNMVTIAADPYSVNELRPLNVSGYTDSTVTVELRMNNMDSIVGLQTSIKLPAALTYVGGSFAPDITRAPGYTATAGLLGDTLTLLLTNLTGTPIHGADGVVARFQLRLHGYGSHTLRLLSTALSDSTGSNVLSAVYTGNVSIYSPYLNCSNSLDLGDTPVTETAMATLPLRNTGNAPLVIDRMVFTQDHWRLLNPLPLTLANNGRDTLRVTYDGTAEGSHSAEMLLYTNDPRNDLKRISLTAQRYEPNQLYMAGNPDASAAMPQVYLMLDNYSDVTALQMDVEYPHNQLGLEPGDISLGERANGHLVSAARLDDSTLRVLLLSLQNSPFEGNSGAVATLQLHAYDSLSTASYPLTLRNVTSACTDGIDRLTSVQNSGWFATRIQHDTAYVPDTTLTPIIVYDTTHRDTLVYDFIHRDSIIYNVIDRDTVVYNIIAVDSVEYTIIDRDTILYNYIHQDSIVYDIVHQDSIIYNIINRDTMVYNITIIDSIEYNISYLDSVEYNITYLDTTIVDSTLVPVTDTLYDTIYLTEYIHDTIVIHDTVFVGIDEVEAINAKIFQRDGRIVVESAGVVPVRVFDVTGRMLTHSSALKGTSSSIEGEFGTRSIFEVPTTGVYLVKIGDAPARRIVVVR